MSINPYLLKANPYLAGHSSIPSWYQNHTQELKSLTGSGGDQSGVGQSGTISAPQPTQAGQGYNSDTVFGGLGTLASMVAGIPGLGMVGAGLGVNRDQNRAGDELSQMGLNGNMDFMSALGHAASFGLAGRSTQGQFNAAAMGVDPDRFTELMGRMNPVALQAVPQGYTGSHNFGDIINDYDNVGRLSEIFGAIDAMNHGGGAGAGSNSDPRGSSGSNSMDAHGDH